MSKIWASCVLNGTKRFFIVQLAEIFFWFVVFVALPEPVQAFTCQPQYNSLISLWKVSSSPLFWSDLRLETTSPAHSKSFLYPPASPRAPYLPNRQDVPKVDLCPYYTNFGFRELERRNMFYSLKLAATAVVIVMTAIATCWTIHPSAAIVGTSQPAHYLTTICVSM